MLREHLESQGLFSSAAFLTVRNLARQAKQYPKSAEFVLELAKKKQLPEDVWLVLVEEQGVDKRTVFYKQLSKLAHAREFALPAGPELKRWIGTRLRKQGFAIEEPALVKFCELMGANQEEQLFDLWQVDSELTKLMLYKLKEKEIVLEDVSRLVRANVSQNIFNLTNLFAEGRGGEAVCLFERMIGAGRESDLKSRAIQLIGALASQVRSLLLIKSVTGSKDEIAEQLSWKPGRVWIMTKLAGKFEAEKLRAMLADLQAIDLRLKSSEESPKLLLELFLHKAKS
jgi:DNA polymerase III delta subunit